MKRSSNEESQEREIFGTRLLNMKTELIGKVQGPRNVDD